MMVILASEIPLVYYYCIIKDQTSSQSPILRRVIGESSQLHIALVKLNVIGEMKKRQEKALDQSKILTAPTYDTGSQR